MVRRSILTKFAVLAQPFQSERQDNPWLHAQMLLPIQGIT